MMDKLVSIIVPVYNVESYLERCVRSLVNQTYLNIEIILVDDGSKDGSGRLCDQFSEQYTNVFSYHKENGGLSDARNYGLRKANGDLISFVDSDDWIDINMIRKLVDELEKFGADIVCCEYFQSDGINIVRKKLSGSVSCLETDGAIRILLANKMYKSHAWNKIFSAEILKNEQFPVGRYYEDIFVMHNWFKKAQKIVFLEEGLYYYFERSNSIIHTAKIGILEDYIAANRKRLHDLQQWEQVNEEMITLAEAGILSSLLLAYLRFPKTNDCVAKKAILREIKAYPRSYCVLLDKKLAIDFLVLKYLRIIYKAWISFRCNDRFWNKIKSIVKRFRKTQIEGTFCKETSDTKRKVILFGVPEYNNLGDIAISYATRAYIKNKFPRVDYYEVSEAEVKNNLNAIAKHVRPDDLILLQGGGNLNDIYQDQNKLRKMILKKFPQNQTILLPQSSYFTRTKRGDDTHRRIKSLFGKHQDLVLLARDPLSEQRMKEYFSNEVFLVPDMVLYLVGMQVSNGREAIGICLRRDEEAAVCLKGYFDIIYAARQFESNLEFINTLTYNNVAIKERDLELEKIWRKFGKCKLVITDRLHGVIFSYITGTPCIAIDTNNGKIAGIVQWMKDSSTIAVCHDVENISTLIEKMLSCQVEEPRRLDLFYEPLDRMIHKWINIGKERDK